MELEEDGEVELEHRVHREEHKYTRARHAPEGLVDLPPPTSRLVPSLCVMWVGDEWCE